MTATHFCIFPKTLFAICQNLKQVQNLAKIIYIETRIPKRKKYIPPMFEWGGEFFLTIFHTMETAGRGHFLLKEMGGFFTSKWGGEWRVFHGLKLGLQQTFFGPSTFPLPAVFSSKF